MAAKERDLWAGIPMPLERFRLVIEEKYPHAKMLMEIGATGSAEEEHKYRGRRAWWSHHLSSLVAIWNNQEGAVEWGIVPGVHNFGEQLETLGASDAWSIESEAVALETLATLVSPRAFKQYLLTGSFIESSQKSKVMYMFRKLRPTVAMVASSSGEMRILCTLCLHPIGYYAGSHAGVMCPTDDVIAHLMLKRGDEKLYWRRANQHHPARPESGI